MEGSDVQPAVARRGQRMLSGRRSATAPRVPNPRSGDGCSVALRSERSIPERTPSGPRIAERLARGPALAGARCRHAPTRWTVSGEPHRLARASAMSSWPERRSSEGLGGRFPRTPALTAAIPACIDQSTGTAQASPSNGRTSTLPRHALDPSAASWSAVSRSGASMIQKPPMSSLLSR